MKEGLVLVRTDANPSIGAGHLMRCLALASGLREKGRRCVFVTRETPDAMAALIAARGFSRIELTRRVTPRNEPDVVAMLGATESVAGLIVDRYGFQKSYVSRIRSKRPGWAVLQFDDTGAPLPGVDVILNQNFHATGRLYAGRTAKGAKLLLGPRFAVLRPEFLGRAARRAAPASVKRVLVTMGGGRHQNGVLGRVLKGVTAAAPEAEVTLVSGFSANGRGLPGRVRVLNNVKDMSTLYERADLAVTGGGSTLLELSRIGVPAVSVVLAENQAGISRAAHKKGLVISLGSGKALKAGRVAAAVRTLSSSRPLRRRMAARQRAAVDGRGVVRVAEAFEAAIRRRRT